MKWASLPLRTLLSLFTFITRPVSCSSVANPGRRFLFRANRSALLKGLARLLPCPWVATICWMLAELAFETQKTSLLDTIVINCCVKACHLSTRVSHRCACITMASDQRQAGREQVASPLVPIPRATSLCQVGWIQELSFFWKSVWHVSTAWQGERAQKLWESAPTPISFLTVTHMQVFEMSCTSKQMELN